MDDGFTRLIESGRDGHEAIAVKAVRPKRDSVLAEAAADSHECSRPAHRAVPPFVKTIQGRGVQEFVT